MLDVLLYLGSTKKDVVIMHHKLLLLLGFCVLLGFVISTHSIGRNYRYIFLDYLVVILINVNI